MEAILVATMLIAALQAQDANAQTALRSISQKTALARKDLPQGDSVPDPDRSPGLDVDALEKHEGFVDFFWDKRNAKIYLSSKGLDQPFLYVTGLASGLGSNPVGLDRGQLGQTRLVRWRKVGKRIYLEQLNTKYRSSSRDKAEQRAVADSFADSIIWAGDVVQARQNQLVFDITELIVRDAHAAADKLSSTGQGAFRFERSRSYVVRERLKAFPRNCEFEAAVTLVSSRPGPLASRASADGRAITLRQHHSFIQLPDPGYRPRYYDQRCGAFSIFYQDYSSPINQSLTRRFITRHRLVRKDPKSPRSEPVDPIVYYVDPGVPSPVKEALIEGASWWNQAFEDAGFVNAFQVRELPPDADPMDVRYNVIQWVHRATRGWSYGQSVVDPRTGEIIKGHVLLGSLRVRQDHLLIKGLQDQIPRQASWSPDPMWSGCREAGGGAANWMGRVFEVNPLEIALARIRQLAAHEVGHTLGFAHNFAASTYGDRASVMDYPAPRTRFVDGKLDLQDAYATGVGVWDRFLVRYAYTQFPAKANERTELNRLVQQAIDKGHVFLSDADARPAGSAHPAASLWDNGSDPVKQLEHEIKVRHKALQKFSENLIDPGQPMSDLENLLVPIYLHHRYQVEATAKMIGGVEYFHAVRGDGQVTRRPVDIKKQARAVEVLLKTLEEKFLAIPEKIVQLLPPKTGNSPGNEERFDSRLGLFDPVTAAETSAEITLAAIMQPKRLARADLQYHNLPPDLRIRLKDLPGLGALGILSRIRESLGDFRLGTDIKEVVQERFIDRLIGLASDESLPNSVRNASIFVLLDIDDTLRNSVPMFKMLGKKAYNSHGYLLQRKIKLFLEQNRIVGKSTPRLTIPPGSPIGGNNGRKLRKH